MRSTRLAGWSDPRHLVVAAFISAASLGCDTVATPCDRSSGNNPAVLYTQGTVENGVYESAPWDGEWLYFPGGMRYTIEHYLGVVPHDIQFFLSFDRYGTRDGGGTAAQAGGDPAQVQAVDDKTITVINGTCSEYWLRVVAQ